jgi:hypothetical protein
MPLRDDVKGKCGTVLLNALKARRPWLDEESMQACMQLLISNMGNLTSELIVRIPFSIMKTHFEGYGLSVVDLITFEDLLSDTPIFPRGASSAFDEFEGEDEAESKAESKAERQAKKLEEMQAKLDAMKARKAQRAAGQE